MRIEPTDKERLAMDESGLSAMPLVTLFYLAPLGAVAGAIIGPFVASSVATGIIAGGLLGIGGGFATGVGLTAIGYAKCKYAQWKFERRVKKAEKQAGKQNHDVAGKPHMGPASSFFMKGRLSDFFRKVTSRDNCANKRPHQEIAHKPHKNKSLKL